MILAGHCNLKMIKYIARHWILEISYIFRSITAGMLTKINHITAHYHYHLLFASGCFHFQIHYLSLNFL